MNLASDSSRGADKGEAMAAQAHIVQRCAGAERRDEAKKKARRKSDAPSNKTYGNCLLGLHCSQKHHAGDRANPRFVLVAMCQQEFPSTDYPQSLVDLLGIVPWAVLC
ncbi:hypothetical protein [uncultured Piscinibacter sp.]|uniref:hypothetical protein n=1 Tax=uncultured Piscinibacter sp. TaxID=1131835 RepID=UPI00261622BB|nr:hypothetical protein [uncultured Piscinibacter sp.]